MPELNVYPFDDPKALDDAGASEVSARGEAIETAWQYYRREHRKPLKVRAGQTDDNVIVNMAREIVDQSVAMLFGQAPTIEIDEAKNTEQEELVRAIFEANGEAIWLQKLATQGAISGHCFVKLVPDPVRKVRLIRLNPRNVTVFWAPDDYEQVVCYRVQYAAGDAVVRQDVVSEGEQWVMRELRRHKDEPWLLLGETVWPWPWAPIVDWQNLAEPEGYYGEGDLVNAALNDAVNFLASNNQRIIKWHGHPKTIGIGVRPEDIKETAVDGFWAIPNAAASVFILEMQSDLGASMGFLQFLQGAFYSEHRAVNLASMKDKLGQMTNFGLRVLFKSALDKCQVKQSLYGAGLAEISRRSLLLLGAGEYRARVSWPDPLPYNRLEQLQALAQESDLGIVSKQTMAADAGRDWDVEQARLEQEQVGQENVGSLILRAFETGQDVRARSGDRPEQNGLARGEA